MDNEKFVGLCPTCEKVCMQVEEGDGWWQCSNCTWIWEPKEKRDLTDRVKEAASVMSDEIYAGEMVDHPAHYGEGIFEAINVIEAWGLGFNLGNAVKYIARAGKKGDRREDLRKAKWYIERELNCATN